MRSKSFATQERKETGRKEAGEFRGFAIMWMGIIEDVFQMEGKECKNQERLKMCTRKSMSERGRCFSMREATLSGPVAVDEKRLEVAARNLVAEKGHVARRSSKR